MKINLLGAPAGRATIALALALGVSGCGLKGALTMPSQSEEIVIRPAPTATPEGEAPGASAGEAAGTPEQPAEKKLTPRDERLPPPPLPGGNPGTARGG